MKGCRGLSYLDRLSLLNLDSLQVRRLRADLIMCFTILNGYTDVDVDQFFTRSSVSQTRGNSCKLFKCHTFSVRESHFFSNRVVEIWNTLPNDVVNAINVQCFKRKIKKINLSSHFT